MASKILSKDQQNFMWISIACVDFIKLPLKDILDYQIKPADLFNRINSSSTHRTYYLRREQENICFIPPPGQPDYNDFDVTLLYTLIRNLCSVSLSLASLNPTKGWGKIPSSSHIRLGDDIERLRLMRNAFAHANSAGIPDAEFQVHWNELKSVIQRIQTFMNSMGSKVNYEQKLADIERTDFEFGDLQKYKLFLEATLNQLKEEKEKDEPAISITGADRVVWGGKTCFEADLKQKETFHWSISWQRVRGSVTNQIDISNEKYRDSTRTKLVIHSVCKDDEGEYQAVLTRDSNGNKRKMESNAIFLHVMGDEAAVSITGADIVLGGEKTCFYAHCNWIEKGIFHWSISWQRVRGSVTNQIDISNKKYRDSSSTQLVIHSVSKDDEGEYKAILARDSNGKKRKIESNAIFLQVVGENCKTLSITPSVRGLGSYDRSGKHHYSL